MILKNLPLPRILAISALMGMSVLAHADQALKELEGYVIDNAQAIVDAGENRQALQRDLRQLREEKQQLKATVDKLVTRLDQLTKALEQSTALTKAYAETKASETEQAAKDYANTIANTANSNANRAQGTANTAVYKANNAQGTANTALSEAKEARRRADKAQIRKRTVLIMNRNQNANGDTLILGPVSGSNLRLGYGSTYSWIQSHGSKPLAINPIGNNVGINTTNPQYKLDVAGIIRGNNFIPSDKRYKQNIHPLDNALTKLQGLRGVSFEWKKSQDQEAGTQIGLIAQEVEGVLPELVSTDGEGYKSIAYGQLTAVLIEAVKEQQQIIEQKSATIAELQLSLQEQQENQAAQAERMASLESIVQEMARQAAALKRETIAQPVVQTLVSP